MRRAQPCAVCHLLVNVPYMFVSTPSAEHSATITITVCGLSISLATPEIDLLHPFISTSTSFMAPGFTTCCTIHQPVEGLAGFSEHLKHSKPLLPVLCADHRGWRKRQVLLQPRDDWQGEMWELTRMLAEFLSDSTYQTGSSQFAAGHVCFLQLINVQRIQTYSTITTIHELHDHPMKKSANPY